MQGLCQTTWHVSCISKAYANVSICKTYAKQGGAILANARSVPKSKSFTDACDWTQKVRGNSFTELFEKFFFIGYIAMKERSSNQIGGST